MYRQPYRLQQNNYQQDNYYPRHAPNVLFDNSPVREREFELNQNQNRIQHEHNRLLQSEESGGLHQQDKFASIQDPSDDEGREGENDVEYIIMNLYSKMKNLEFKYIDLANFYKQELVKSSKRITEEDRQNPHYQYRARDELGLSQSFEKSPHNAHIDQSVSLPMLTFTARTRRLRQKCITLRRRNHQRINRRKEKGKVCQILYLQLEDDMKQLVNFKGNFVNPGNTQQHQQSPPRVVSDFQGTVQSPESRNFLKEQLKEALTDILDSVENTQRQQMKVLSSKQNDMFQVSTKFNLANQVKNEALGLWYDAKTKVAQAISELKNQINKKARDVDDIRSFELRRASDKAELVQIQENFEEIKDLEVSLNRFKIKNELQNKNFKRIKSSIKFKQGQLKDDQSKIMAMIQDMQSTIQYLDENTKKALMLSGEKSNNLMSPFEKRLANYQRTAELRKDRSGSRGKPIPNSAGFPQYNPQITNMNNQLTSETHQDIRMLKTKAKNLEYVFQDFQSKLQSQIQENSDLEKYFEQNLSDQLGVISKIEDTVNERKTLKDTRSKSSKDYILPNSPQALMDDRKVGDLQKNNDKLFADLRIANEKYLNQRVENSRINDQLQIVQNALEDAQQQIKILQASDSSSLGQRQKIRMKTSTQRAPVSELNDSQRIQRENDQLKTRLNNLEKEYFNLSQENVRRGGQGISTVVSEPQYRMMQNEANENKQNVERLCIQVQRFLLAMKRLQRAVNNKDKDIPIYKTDFEQNKKGLENLVKEIKDIQEQKSQNPGIHSYTIGRQQKNNSLLNSPQYQQIAPFSQERAGPSEDNYILVQQREQRDRSQPPIFQGRKRSQFGDSQKQETSYDDSLNMKQGSVKMKSGIPPQPQRPSENEQLLNEKVQRLEQELVAKGEELKQHVEEMRNQREDMKQQREDIENLRQKLENLKDQNEELQMEKNTIQVKILSLQENNTSFINQAQSHYERSKKYEEILGDFKERLLQIQDDQEQSQEYGASKLYHELIQKEREYIQSQLVLENQQPSTNRSNRSQQSPPKITQAQQVVHLYRLLREELTEQIIRKEEELDTQMLTIQQQLQDKEEELERVKRLLIDKLREVEQSFHEVSQEINENELSQQEAYKRFTQQQTIIHQNQEQMKQFSKNKEMDRSVDNVISRIEESQREEELDKLIQVNEELLQENGELREALKDLENAHREAQDLRSMKEEYYQLKEENDQLVKNVEDLLEAEQMSKQMIETMKEENKKMVKLVKDTTKTSDNHEEKAKQLNQDLQNQINNLNKDLAQEQEKRVFHEQEAQNKAKQLKVQNTENQSLQNELQKLKNQIQELEQKVENQKTEDDFMKSLNSVKEIHEDEGSLDQDDSVLDNANEQIKIDQNPYDMAQQYLKLLKSTKKEYQILKNQHEKLQNKSQEIKEKYDELKQDERENAEALMNMETKVFDLESQNEKLIKEVQKLKGDNVEHEDHLRKELEDKYKQLVSYKDSEIENMTNKLAKISQLNIDLTSKCNRLEQNNQQLSTDYQFYHEKASTLEMQLEMTKADTERDTEKLVELHKVEQEEKSKLLQRAHDQEEKLKEIDELKKKLEADLKQREEQLESLQNESKQSKAEMNSNQMLSNSIKSALEAKINETKQLLEQEQKIKEQTLKEKEELLEKQKKEKEKLQQEFRQQKQQIDEQYQKELKNEKQRQEDLLRQRQAKEDELLKSHDQEIKQLEQRLKEEREQQESRLKEGEKEKLDRVRKEMEEERERLLKNKEEEMKREKERQVEEELKKLQDHLDSQNKEAFLKAEKQRTLVFKLQQHIRKVLEEQLKDLAIQLEEQKIERQMQIDQLKEQYEEQQRELEKAQIQELEILTQKLNDQRTQEMKEQLKKQNKQMALVHVLQARARNVLLQEVDEQVKLKKQIQQDYQERLQEKEEEHSKLMQLKIEQTEIDIKTIEDQMERKRQKEVEKFQQEMQDQLLEREEELQRQESLIKKQLEEKDQECAQLKEEQEKLVQNLTQQQDQQSQLLLAQKEKEKQDLIEQYKKSQEEDQERFENEKKEILTKNTTLQKMQEKIQQELQQKLEQSIKEKEDALKANEDEMKQLKDQLQSELKAQESKSENEKQEITAKLTQAHQEKEKQIKEKETEIAQQKKEQEQLLQKINEEKDKQIKDLQEKLEKDVAEIKESHSKAEQKLQQDKQLEIQQLQEKHDKHLNELKQQQEQEGLKLKKDQQEEIKKLKESHESNNHAKDQEVQQLNEKLVKDLQELKKSHQKEKEDEVSTLVKKYGEDLKKKEEESNQIMQSLQEKLNQMQQDYQHELESKDKEKSDDLHKNKESYEKQLAQVQTEKDQLLKQYADLVKSSDEKERQYEKEREYNFDQIQEMSDQIEEYKENIKQLKENLDQRSKELETYQVMSNESQNKQNKHAKELRDQLTKKEHECNNLKSEVTKKDSRVNDLLIQLRQKDDDMKNVEKDLDAFDKENQDLQKEIDEYKKLNEDLNAKIIELQKVNEELNQQMSKENSSSQLLQEKIKELNEELRQQNTIEKEKMDETQELRKQLEEEQEKYQHLQEKIEELKQQYEDSSARKVESDQKVNEKESLIQSLQAKNEGLKKVKVELENKIDILQEKNDQLSDEVNTLKGHNSEMNNSVEKIQSQLGEFKIQLIEIQQISKDLEKQKQINKTMIEGIEQGEDNIVAEIGQEHLQYCKKVKYLDKTWVLVVRDNQYFWVDLEKVPIETVKKLHVDEVEDCSSKLEQKLNDLQHQKTQLEKMMVITNRRREQVLLAMDPKDKKIEELKDSNNLLTQSNNSLQSEVLSLKQKLKVLSETIDKMNDREKQELFKENQQLKQVVIANNKVIELKEQEIEKLIEDLEEKKKQLMDGDSLIQVKSFVKDDNLDQIGGELSDIKPDDEEEDADEVDLPQEKKLNVKSYKGLQSEKETFKKLAEDLDTERKKLEQEVEELKQISKTQQEQQEAMADMDKQEFEQLKQMLLQFFEKVPMTIKQNEDFLPIILSMMHVGKKEQDQLSKKRQQLSEEQTKGQKKGGWFGKK